MRTTSASPFAAGQSPSSGNTQNAQNATFTVNGLSVSSASNTVTDAVPGVTVANFLRTAVKSVRGAEVPVKDFRKLLKEKMKLLQVGEGFATRYVNDGFSGGEKKRLEMLQMAVLAPKLAVLDETDSGLDIDALRVVAAGINGMASGENSILLITHYQRILEYVKPHSVHVLLDGQIAQSGGPEMAHELEKKGYDWLQAKEELHA